MEKISNIAIKPMEKSIYIKPFTMHFTQNGAKRTWDLINVHDSVIILLFNKTRKKLIFVKQFRPAVYFGSVPEEDRKESIDIEKYPAELGITIELCAGIVDKPIPLREVAREEVLEECGYEIKSSQLEKIGSYRSGAGTSAALQTAYYCEVTDEMRVNLGGGVEDELIDVVEMSIEEVKQYMKQEKVRSPPSFMFAMYWFLYNKLKDCS